MKSEKELLQDILKDKKKLPFLILPLFIALPTLFMAMTMEDPQEGDVAADSSSYMDLTGDSVAQYTSKKEAYNAEGMNNSSNKMVSSNENFFGDWHTEEENGYMDDLLQEDTTTIVIEDPANSDITDDFSTSSNSNYNNQNNYEYSSSNYSSNNGSSTVTLYEETTNPYSYEDQVITTAYESTEPQEEMRTGVMTGNLKSSNNNVATGPAHISAIIHNKGNVVTNGSTVRIRINEEYKIGKYVIPKNSIIYGQASLAKERVYISINSLNLNGTVVPVKLEAYDLQGIRGIYNKDLLGYQIKNEAADEAIDESSTTIDIGQLGSITTEGIKKKKDFTEVFLNEGHPIILKEI